jgi:hypothetical protein
MSSPDENTVKTRPFLFAVICFSIFIFSGFIGLLFLMALLFNSWMTQTLIEFFPERDLSSTSVFLLTLAFFLINSLNFVGAYFLWKMKKSGFYYFLTGTLVFIALPYILGYGNYISSVILLMIVFLLSIYYRKLS